jgi:hypothetical protein
MFRPGSDEMHIVLGQYFGKPRILGEEAVAGMNRIRPGDLAGGKQGRDVQVAVFGRRRPDADAFVSQTHMHRVVVRRRVHGNGSNAELLAGS